MGLGEWNLRTIRTLLKFFALLCALLLAATLLLYLAGLLPQSTIEKNLLDSVYQLALEGGYPHMLDSADWSSMVDMTSENCILNLSYYMDTLSAPSSIFTNPNKEGAIGAELGRAIEEHVAADKSYSRYWGGFRVWCRLLLSIFTYPQLRRVLSLVFTMLAGGTGLFLYRRTKSLSLPLSFLLVLGLLNPAVVSSTMQFSCCFFLAMLGILLLPRTEGRFMTFPTYFFLIGAATQYFDFYTTPVLTFGMPMLALLAFREADAPDQTPKSSFALSARCFAAWFAAYLLMWVGKLTLTTLLTDLDAYGDGFGAAANRLFHSAGGVDGSFLYRALVVFWRVFMRVFHEPVFLLLSGAVVLTVWLVLFLRKENRWRRLGAASVYLCIATLPLVWFALVSGPSLKHSWFQYRGIGVFLFGILLFVIESTAARFPAGVPPRENVNLEASPCAERSGEARAAP